MLKNQSGRPPGALSTPKAAQRIPKRLPRDPKGAQKGTQGGPRRPQGRPRGTQGGPKSPPGAPKEPKRLPKSLPKGGPKVDARLPLRVPFRVLGAIWPQKGSRQHSGPYFFTSLIKFDLFYFILSFFRCCLVDVVLKILVCTRAPFVAFRCRLAATGAEKRPTGRSFWCVQTL